MFKLNFKENLKEIVVDEIADIIGDELFPKEKQPQENDFIQPPSNIQAPLQPITESPINSPVNNIDTYRGPLHTDKYEELIDLIHTTSKNNIIVKRQQGKNLFTVTSVLTIFLTLLTSILVQVDLALSDGKFSSREGIQVAIILIGGATSIFARGTEGSQGVWTPHGMPGLDKEDFDGDGIINELDNTPYG